MLDETLTPESVTPEEPLGQDLPVPVRPEPESYTHTNQTTLSEYLESLLVTVILALFGTSFVVQAFKIPSQSMERTLLVGDHLLVNKFIFGGRGAWYDRFLPYRELQRGDIIVFKFPYQDHPHFVKRVIGLPGDRLKIVDQQVYVNGKPMDEPYAVHDPAAGYGDPLNYNFPPVGTQMYLSSLQPEWAHDIPKHIQGDELVVPPGKYFAMGDNRDHSLDSRYWGFVDRDAIMGRPFLIYWSINASSADYGNTTFAQRVLGIFDTLVHLPARTRWNRMLHTVH
ncbi:MAG TPA: signal peptidase I [Candidatus Acidoferrales bacterium]|jgi:signal peptidase I|nr:signal peptidase I [Candidatus Acidoferrales bacterium]